MARAIRWSPEALDDIDEIQAFIARGSPAHARLVVSEIFALAATLAEFSERGRVVPEFGQPNLREVFLYSFRLMYEVKPNEVQILAVLHGKRLVDPALRRNPPFAD